LTIYFSQGSVATDLRGGDNFNSGFLRRFFMNLTVKKLWKLVHVCRSFAIWCLGGPVIVVHHILVNSADRAHRQ